MAGYIIVDVEVTDPVSYQEYRRQVMPTLAPYGGKFLVRGGRTERLEGTWDPGRIVVLEFPDVSSAKAWWSSEVYRGPRGIRQSASVTDMIVVEGA